MDGALIGVAADIEPEHVVAGAGAGYNAGFEEREVQE